MGIKTIPLSRLEANLRETLNECADSGQAFVIELPDQRLVTLQALEPSEDDALIDELLASNAAFQALVAKSKSGPRKSFGAGPGPGEPGPDAEKPIGLVYVAISFADEKKTRVTELNISGDRERIRLWASQHALELLRKGLLERG